MTDRGLALLLTLCLLGAALCTGALILQARPQGEGGRTQRPSVSNTPSAPRATPLAVQP